MQCELCERDVENGTSHHLIPRSRDKKSKKRINLCKPCHGMIHRFFTNRDLESKYHDLATIKKHPEVLKFLVWVKKQDPNKKIKIR
jgi:hypothetical protein